MFLQFEKSASSPNPIRKIIKTKFVFETWLFYYTKIRCFVFTMKFHHFALENDFQKENDSVLRSAQHYSIDQNNPRLPDHAISTTTMTTNPKNPCLEDPNWLKM